MNRIQHLYSSLRKKHGSPRGQWSLWCRRPKTLKEKEQVVIETVLTQRANWKNVELAVCNLDGAGNMSLRAIADADREKLSFLIRPSGFYRQKAERLRMLARYLLNDCGGMACIDRIPSGLLREGLLLQNGVGPETADDILLYAFEQPYFVVDAYTRRIFSRLGLIKPDWDYDKIQKFFMDNLKDVKGKDKIELFKEYHALIVELAKRNCKTKQICEDCLLKRSCSRKKYL